MSKISPYDKAFWKSDMCAFGIVVKRSPLMKQASITAMGMIVHMAFPQIDRPTAAMSANKNSNRFPSHIIRSNVNSVSFFCRSVD